MRQKSNPEKKHNFCCNLARKTFSVHKKIKNIFRMIAKIKSYVIRQIFDRKLRSWARGCVETISQIPLTFLVSRLMSFCNFFATPVSSFLTPDSSFFTPDSNLGFLETTGPPTSVLGRLPVAPGEKQI